MDEAGLSMIEERCVDVSEMNDEVVFSASLNTNKTIRMRRERHKIKNFCGIEEAVELPPEVLALVKPASN